VTSETVLTRADYDDFLVFLFFGDMTDPLRACARRAYLDFSRTMHGIDQARGAREMRQEAEACLCRRIAGLVQTWKGGMGCADFDAWHRATCDELIASYAKCNYKLYPGQAQKWVNMTLKYAFTLGEKRLPGYRPFYAFCHAPLDNVMLARLGAYGFPALSCAWSRLKDYPTYLSIQDWIRQRFPLAPLDAEFLLFRGRPLPGGTGCSEAG
jgi:hypothetical protein